MGFAMGVEKLGKAMISNGMDSNRSEAMRMAMELICTVPKSNGKEMHGCELSSEGIVLHSGEE